jgi:hypothetical protein
VNDYCLTKGKHCDKDKDEYDYSCEFIRPYVEHELYYCNKEKGEWVKDETITTAEQYCDRKILFDFGYATCSYQAIADKEEPDCEEGDTGCDQWDANLNVIEYCEIPSGYGLTLPSESSNATNGRCEVMGGLSTGLMWTWYGGV